MQNALTVAIQSMHNDQSRMETISRNLANIATTGYKRETASMQPFPDVLRVAIDGGTGTQAISVPQVTNSVDTRAGSLKHTGEPLDVAIEGEGYFEVEGPAGRAYTRKGRFQLDARGRLSLETGETLMGRGGEMAIAGTRPEIDRAGNILDGGRTVGRLKVVRFDDPSKLLRVGGGLFAPAEGVSATEAEVNVRQGYVENSNVSSMTEMVRLIETVRHFEASQKVVQGYDEMMEKALRKLGEL